MNLTNNLLCSFLVCLCYFHHLVAFLPLSKFPLPVNVLFKNVTSSTLPTPLLSFSSSQTVNNHKHEDAPQKDFLFVILFIVSVYMFSFPSHNPKGVGYIGLCTPLWQYQLHLAHISFHHVCCMLLLAKTILRWRNQYSSCDVSPLVGLANWLSDSLPRGPGRPHLWPRGWVPCTSIVSPLPLYRLHLSTLFALELELLFSACLCPSSYLFVPFVSAVSLTCNSPSLPHTWTSFESESVFQSFHYFDFFLFLHVLRLCPTLSFSLVGPVFFCTFLGPLV